MTDMTEPPEKLTITLNCDGQRLVRRFREACMKVLETPEDKRGSKNGYKKRVADRDEAANDLATWVEVIAEQEEAKS